MNRHAINRHTTRALASRLRALAPAGPRKKKPGRWPRPLPPTRIEDGYHAAIRRMVCDLARECFRSEEGEIFHALAQHRAIQGLETKAPRADAGPFRGGAKGFGQAAALGRKKAKEEAEELRRKAKQADDDLRRASEQGKRAARAIDRAAEKFADVFKPQALHDVVLGFGKATDKHAREQLDTQLRSAIGVPLSAIERPFRDQMEGWAALNIDLIVTVPDRYFDRLRLDVLDAFEGGTHPSTLAEDFEERYDMSSRDAERIARDQVLSLQSELNQERMTSMGVDRYYWRSANDGRVRDNHEELAARSMAGETFAFDDPPMGGGTSDDEPGNPGDGILCRCFPEPVLDDLIN